MSLLGVFAGSFVVALSGALMPGPLLTATVGASTKQGSLAGPLLIVGHAVLEMLLIALLLVGLAPILGSKAFVTGVSFAGGAILLWMAIDMFRSLPRLTLSSDAAPANRRRYLVISGIVLSLANPYWIIWWVTIGLGLLLSSRASGPAGVIAFFSGHIIADFVWYSMVSVSIGHGRKLFSNQVYRGLIAVCATVLAVFSGLFLLRGWRGLG